MCDYAAELEVIKFFEDDDINFHHFYLDGVMRKDSFDLFSVTLFNSYCEYVGLCIERDKTSLFYIDADGEPVTLYSVDTPASEDDFNAVKDDMIEQIKEGLPDDVLFSMR